VSEHFEKTNQNDSTNEGNDETAEIETIDRTIDTEETKDPAAEDGTDDTDDDVEEDALLAISTHKHRGDPTDQSTEDNIDEETHKCVVNKLLILTIEFDGGFRSGNSLAHHEHSDDTPGDDVVHEHGEDSGPLEDATLSFGHLENGDKGRSERCGDRVDEAGETGAGIGSEKFQDEPKGEEHFDETEDIPNNLRPAIEWLCAAG